MKTTTSVSNDGELLQAFGTTNDQEAFAELMRRHGRMVFCAARSVVEDASAAEDIVQATFLTLVRKRASVESADSVAGWLCRVAVCLARDERRKVVRRAAREKEAAMLFDEPDEKPGIVDGVVSALYEELANLGEKYRRSIILHHMEGLSYEVAAPMCGCSEQAYSMRLTRAREKLRARLVRRGVALSATALVAGLGQSASAAELPAGFVAATCAAAQGGAVSAKVGALTQSALKMLFWAKVKTVAAVCAGVVVVGGAGVGAAVTLPLVLGRDVASQTEGGQGEQNLPDGMVLIPGGRIAGKDADGVTLDLEIQTLLIDTRKTTKSLWDEVRTWSLSHGYTYDNTGAAQAPDQPVFGVNWMDCVRWCNARSEMNGLEPVYYTDAACHDVCRTGTGNETTHVKKTANGHRLPTVEEWNYAARGGKLDQRFPWVPNGYGLQNMAGGAAEWCFDLGTKPGSRCYCGSMASLPILAGRGMDRPVSDGQGMGFRTVRIGDYQKKR